MSKYVKTEEGYKNRIGREGSGVHSEIFNDYINNVASGDYSHAEGDYTTASGYDSHAEGNGTTASGDYSHAEGVYTKASSSCAHAEGVYTKASGYYSHAEGAYAKATATNDSVSTTSTTSNGYYTHAEGYGTVAYGRCSHAEGNGTKASGYDSHAEGKSTTASGNSSHAEGIYTTASGNYSHAEGGHNGTSESTVTLSDGTTIKVHGSVAYGSYSHAEGTRTVAYGHGSHAEGVSTIAFSEWSHAEGMHTTASGTYSHAEGSYTTASGSFAHAEGYHTTALKSQHAQGHYNNTSTAIEGEYTGTVGTAFVIGNGDSTSNSNAFRITYAGETYAKAAYNSTGADYAEFFEWLDGNPNAEDRRGYFVTLDGDKIKIANKDDYILGIISGQPSVIGNSDEDWMGRYIMDDFGAFITEEFEYEEEVHEIEMVEEEVEETVMQEDESGELKEIVKKRIVTVPKEVTKTVTRKGTKYKENPDYDKTRAYIQRIDRPEWSAVGMLGVLSVRDDGTCQVNGYCSVADGGIATASDTGYRVIKRISDNVVKVIFK